MKKGNANTFLSVETCRSLARCRGSLYNLLSSAYIHIPAKKTLEFGWEPAVELLGFPQEESEEALQHIDKGLNLIKPYGSRKSLLEEKTLTDLSKDWTRLFRGVERDGILPPYESLYRTGKLQEKPAREIHRLFSQMGIRVPDEWHQPQDYIGVELDFMRLLCSREFEACEKQEQGTIAEAINAEQSFVENHLGEWVPQFCEKMVSHAREDYYRGLAHLTVGLIGYDRIHAKNRVSAFTS
jgi:TorA maturation chaperone TorD